MFEARGVLVNPRDDAMIVKVKKASRLSMHNIFSFESAYVEELIEEREPYPAQMDINQPAADGNAAVGGADEAQHSRLPCQDEGYLVHLFRILRLACLYYGYQSNA